MMNVLKYIAGKLGKSFRRFFKIRLPKNIYKSLGFHGTFLVPLNGKKIIFNNFRDEISNDIFYSGIFGNYEGFSLKIWNHLCLKVNKSYVLDVGGYTGVYSLVAASANSQINIQTYEPHPNTFKLLKKNIFSNSYKNINLNNFALSDKDEDLIFYNSLGNCPSGFSSINHSFIEKDSGTLACKARNINDVLQNECSDMKISLIKIDIERAELPLLTLIIKRIIHDQTCVLCEVLDWESYNKFDELFTANHFYSILIDDVNHKAMRVEKLNGEEKVGRNILFVPKELDFEIDKI